MDLETMLRGALPPIVAALVLVTLGGVRLLPLAMIAGLYTAYALLKRELPAWPHELWSEPDGRQWLLWGVITAGLAASFEQLRACGPRFGTTLGLAVGALSLWLMLVKQIPRWGTIDVFDHVVGGALVVALLGIVGREALARAPAGIASAVVFAVVLSVDAALLTLGASAFLGQLCGAVAAAVGAAAGTSLWRQPFALTAADGVWIGTAHGLFLLAGVHLGLLPWSAAALALVAPGLLLLLPCSAAKRPLPWTVAALVAVLLPLGGAAWLAHDAGGG